MLSSGACGEMIYKNNLKQKILLHCPFKLMIDVDVMSLGVWTGVCWVYSMSVSLYGADLTTGLKKR